MYKFIVAGLLVVANQNVHAFLSSCNHWFGGVSHVSGPEHFTVKSLSRDIGINGKVTKFDKIELNSTSQTEVIGGMELQFRVSPDSDDVVLYMYPSILKVSGPLPIEKFRADSAFVAEIPSTDGSSELWIVTKRTWDSRAQMLFEKTKYQVLIYKDYKIQKIINGNALIDGKFQPQIEHKDGQRLLKIMDDGFMRDGLIFE